MNGCILPGRTISSAAAVRFGITTETDGTAICAVTAARAVSAFTRDLIPTTSTPITASAHSAGTNHRRLACTRGVFF